jgi:hypothetical protein
MKRYQILFACLLMVMVAQGQISQEYSYSYPDFKASDDHALLLNIENHNFLKNNEYFGDYIEGETLLGYDFEPSLIYYPGSRIRLKAGVHMKKYSGVESFTNVMPILSAHAILADSLQMILGSLRGNVQHQMLEPIFDTEFLYTDPVENGIQFLYHNNWFKGDMWVNWEQFIFKGDTIPEMLTFGLSSSFQIFSNDQSRWSIPLQLMVFHRGGQTSNFDESMLTLNNGATGFTYEQDLALRYIKKIQINAQYLWFADLTEKWGLPFTHGYAWYPSVVLSNQNVQLMGGYFYGNNYASPKGSQLFQSVSNYNPNVYSPERQLLTAKFAYHYPLAKGVNVSALADVYYDLVAGNMEYAYGVSLHVNPQFFIAKLPESR